MWKVLIIAAISISSFAYGALVVRYKVFPYRQVVHLKKAVFGDYWELAAISTREAQFDKFTPQVDVVFIGDSLTEVAIWNDIFPEVKLSNRGLVGATTDRILNRLVSIRSLNADIAFIMVGINDVRRGYSTVEIMRNYDSIVGALRSDGTRVVIQSTIECERSACGDTLDAVRDLNGALKEHAAKESLEFVDLNSRMAHSESGLLPQLSTDGVHLTTDGYVVWASQIEPFLVGY